MTDRPRHPRWNHLAPAALLLLHAALAAGTAWRKTPTVDEVAHLPAGISYWQTGTFELYHHNPPLIKLLAALPALATQPQVDYSQSWTAKQQWGMPRSPWAFGWEFMYANAARHADIYFWARLPIILLSILTGILIYRWSSELFGPGAAILALALWTLCPNAIAHAGLVTTDMGATSIGFLAAYAFWKYLRTPNWRRASLCGLALGTAQLTKFSLLPLYGLWPALWFAWRSLSKSESAGPVVRARPDRDRTKPTAGASPDPVPGSHAAGRSLLQLGAMTLISVAVINVGYGFEGSFTRLGDYTFLSDTLTRPRQRSDPAPAAPVTHPWYSVIQSRHNRFAGTWLAHLPVPLPRHYVEGFDEQKLESEGVDGQGYPVYLCGELRRTGWWWYYFFALAVKVPVGTWLLTAGAIVAALALRARARVNDELVLLAPITLTLIVMSFLTDINLGLRYVLPILPFWFVAAGRVAALAARSGIAAIVLVAAIAWNAAAAAWVHPHHLAYFNVFVGGPARGHQYLIDSNLDWGQDLHTLDRWLRLNRPGESVRLAYFGNVDPSILSASGKGFEWRMAPPRRYDDLAFVAAKRGSTFADRHRRWMESHAAEVSQWLAAEHARGRAPHPNEHPGVRSMMVEELELTEGPQPGLFAISVNFMTGLPFRLRDQTGNLWNARQDAYSYFRRWTPIARVGYSIWVFDVSREQAEAARAELGLAPLPPGAVP